MTRTALIPATSRHALLLAPHMRRADVDEVWAAGRVEPREALRLSLDRSLVSWAWVSPDRVLAVGGVGAGPSGALGNSGVPWLLGAEAINRHPAAFLRMSLEVTRRARMMFPHLFNWTDDRHHASHRWLRWLGFTLADPAPFGALGLPFRYFEMRA